MPPNLGGFFMVRSYYPSECHADYFDFERIEALKPAIEACGISTLSQSPMLGFQDRKSGSAGMPRPISYAVFCLKKKKMKRLRIGTLGLHLVVPRLHFHAEHFHAQLRRYIVAV